MQKLIFLFFIFGCPIQVFTQAYPIQDDVKRIVFLGNSITYQGQYIEYIEAWLLSRYPEQSYEFINVGLPSETLSGLSEPNHAGGAFPRPDLHDRLERVLEKNQPRKNIRPYPSKTSVDEKCLADGYRAPAAPDARRYGHGCSPAKIGGYQSTVEGFNTQEVRRL